MAIQLIVRQETFSGDIVTNLQYQIEMLRERITLVAQGKGKLLIKLSYPSGAPVANIRLSSPKTYDDQYIYTDVNGTAEAEVFDPRENIIVSLNYADMTFDKTVRCLAGDITEVIGTVTLNEFADVSVSGQKLTFSSNTPTISFAMCGGGGGGSAPLHAGTASGTSVGVNAGKGGGGGNIIEKTNFSITPYTEYPVSIGSGGNAKTSSTAASSGGTTSAFGLSASGGSVGGGGVGGIGSWGTSDMSRYTAPKAGTGGGTYFGINLGGGGGGGGVGYYSTYAGHVGYTGLAGASGSVNGGKGGSGAPESSGIGGANGTDGGIGGGGGGGSLIQNADAQDWRGSNSGAGGRGHLRVKMNFVTM